MKKYSSVFGLIARGSVYEIITTMVLMVIAEIILFYNRLNHALRLVSADFSMEKIETVMDQSLIKWVFAVGAIIITLSLFIMGSENNNTKTNYTIRRLSISEREFFFCQATYNTLIYIILWAVQTALVFGLCIWYTNSAPENTIGNQTVFLAFYRNEFLHSLLPLDDAAIWVRNIALAIGLGFAAAEFPYKQRRHKNSTTAIALLLYAIIYFGRGIGDLFNAVLTIMLSLAIIGETLYTVFKNDEEEVIENETK